ncbi:MAG: hypothetical protein ACOYM2_12655, partial [Rectinemataceae bacterium]
ERAGKNIQRSLRTRYSQVRTYGFFNQNVVSEYSHEEAVADGVNVGYDVFVLDTKVTRSGAGIKARELVDFREKLSRRRRMEELGEDLYYSGKDLDRDVVNPSQIRTIARAYRELAPTLFPGRGEIPKTLIFAKTDSHAEDIIQIFREEFGEGNDFCKKVTYRSEDPKSTLARFRNAYWPRIAVTVDMIATGTDVRSLECLIFMRDVRSANYFEQMKGRGTRTISLDDLRKVTPSAREVKDHFVIIDAVGVTKSRKTASRALNAKPGIPLASLLQGGGSRCAGRGAVYDTGRQARPPRSGAHREGAQGIQRRTWEGLFGEPGNRGHYAHWQWLGSRRDGVRGGSQFKALIEGEEKTIHLHLVTLREWHAREVYRRPPIPSWPFPPSSGRWGLWWDRQVLAWSRP